MTPERIEFVTSLAHSKFGRNFKPGMSGDDIGPLVHNCWKLIRLIANPDEVDEAIKSFNDKYGIKVVEKEA
jgi:hypothetical protein